MSQPNPTTRERIFLTGATGALGLAAIPRFIDDGHHVTALARTPEAATQLVDQGVTTVQLDLFDEPAVRDAVEGTTVVAHFATSIPAGMSAAKRSAWATNDRLRLEGTANLIAAAEATGAYRFIFESITLPYPDCGDAWIDESLPFAPVASMLHSAVSAEELVRNFRGDSVNLRFGRLYGPGRASDGLIESIRSRSMPVVGSGRNYVSSIHSADAGAAIAAAVTVAPGDYNIVDDEPLTQRALADSLADLLGAAHPRRIPYPLARIIIREAAKVLSVSQRVGNQRFRDATGWAPAFPSAIDGFANIVEHLQPSELASA